MIISPPITPYAAQLEPVPMERLRQIVARLMLHFPYDEKSAARLRKDYIAALKHYPEDLLCAAYLHVLKHHPHDRMPPPSEMIHFMEPEMRYRQKNKNTSPVEAEVV